MGFRYVFVALALAACASPVASPPPDSPETVRHPAPPPAETVLDPASHRSGEYQMDPRHTSVTWRVRHMGLSIYTARFDRKSGSLNFDARHPEESTLSVIVEVASVNTGDVNRAGESGVFDREIATALGAAAHPQITFVSTSIERTGPITGLVRGALTLNGVTRPVTLETTFTGGRRFEDRELSILAFSARTTISRAEFGVAQWSEFAGDDVEILVEAEFDQ